MESQCKESASLPTICEWCTSVGTSQCGRCHAAYYCSRDHQLKHWATHKKVCKKSEPPGLPVGSLQSTKSSSTSIGTLPTSGDGFPKTSSSSKKGVNPLTTLKNVCNTNTCDISPEKTFDYRKSNREGTFSSPRSERFTSDNKFWHLICGTQNISDDGKLFETDRIARTGDQNISPHKHAQYITEDAGLMQTVSLDIICDTVIRDMNSYGICVMDPFIGTKCGNLVLQEVKDLYSSGTFKKGEILRPNPSQTEESVRSDVTTWVSGTEPNCKHIGNLLSKIDIVVTTCNKMPKSGLLSEYKLHRRTKAMVACYPGDGTYYKKHIDNPHKDGRRITCIYYLNQDWNVKTQGGLLRVFPTANKSIASIEPIFDRMVFFWSDKRNPHEVLPSFANRFAVTVWYFDADERDQALKNAKERTPKKSRNLN